MSDQLPILRQLGDELERATRLDEQRRPARRSWRPHGLPLAILIVGLSATSVAAATTHLFGLAAPVSAPRPGEAPPEAVPVASTMRLAGVPAADPGGLPAWDVRVSRSRTGEICTAVGQVVDGQFGIVGLDHQFRALPLGAADACGARPKADEVQVGARAAVGRGDMTPRTLIVGVAGADVTQVALLRGARSTPLPLGRGRAFVAALEGLPELLHPRIQVTTAAGQANVIRLADSGKPEVPDPDGGVPWMLDVRSAKRFSHPMLREYRKPPAGLTCMRGVRQGDSRAVETGTNLNQASTPLICRGDTQTDPMVATIRRLSPNGGRTAQRGFFYGLNPARTIAAGLVSDDVERLELRTPTGPRPVAITDKRAFLIVLDGHTDPNALSLQARLRDGSLVTQSVENARLLSYFLQPIHPPTDPPYAEVRDAVRQNARAARGRLKKVAGTDAIGPTVPDPAGGPPWAAHAWATHTDGPATGFADTLGVGKERELWCGAFGPLVDGTVRAARGRGVGPGEPESWFGDECTPERMRPGLKDRRFKDRPIRYFTSPQIYVDDPAKAEPHIVRVSLSGVYPRAVRAEVLGVPGRKAVPAVVGPRGATLALLGPEAARPGVMLRFRLHFADGTRTNTDYTVFSPNDRKIVARAVDPKGGAGWGIGMVGGYALGKVPGSPGQLVDGRAGQISDTTGTLFLTQGISMQLGEKPLSASNPVKFQQGLFPDRAESPDSLSPADIARRTLPGRTVVYGSAIPGVTRVTIHTPRDVRTLRPSEDGGAFLAVYDGRFTQGKITVVATGPGIRATAVRPADPYVS